MGKSFEIHGQGNISVTGTARDNASLLQTLDLLRKAREIQGLKVEQIRGTPAQFRSNGNLCCDRDAYVGGVRWWDI